MFTFWWMPMLIAKTFVFEHCGLSRLTFHSPPATWIPGLRRRWKRRWNCWLLSLPLWPGKTCLFQEARREGCPSREFFYLRAVTTCIIRGLLSTVSFYRVMVQLQFWYTHTSTAIAEYSERYMKAVPISWHWYIHLPVKRCGNLIGRMTASFKASFAPSNPATSFHLMFGFSMIMAPVIIDQSIRFNRLLGIKNIKRVNKKVLFFS